MNGSSAVDFRVQPKQNATASAVGRNPFFTIEKRNHEKNMRSSQQKKWEQAAVLQTFDEWDFVILAQLKQLSKALMPELRQKPYLGLLWVLSKNELFWAAFGRMARYRIVRNRKEGSWKLQLFKNNAYSSDYSSINFVKIRFVMDDRSCPMGFHLCRGADNKFFSTDSLSEDELTRGLICHFSQLSAGYNIEADLEYLKFLFDCKSISAFDYSVEKKELLSNKIPTKLFLLPVKPAHVALRNEARRRLVFSVFCVLLIGAILIYARRYSYGDLPSAAQQTNLLIQQGALKLK